MRAHHGDFISFTAIRSLSTVSTLQAASCSHAAYNLGKVYHGISMFQLYR